MPLRFTRLARTAALLLAACCGLSLPGGAWVPGALAQSNDYDADSTPDSDTTEAPATDGGDVDSGLSNDNSDRGGQSDDSTDSSTSGNGDVDSSGTTY